MVPRYAEADLAINFEASSGCEKTEGWRPERVRRREDYPTVVDATGVWRWFGRAANCEVPFEEVRFEWFGVVV